MSHANLEQPTPPLVSVVIVNYNSGGDLAACVRSIMNSEYPRKELIIVDNASNDNSLALVDISHSDLTVARSPVNLGYSRAANIGIAKSKGDFLVVMNPDTATDPHWLNALVDAARRHTRAAFFQPKLLLLTDPRILNSAGNLIHIAGFGVCRGIGMPDAERYRESEISYSSGACTLARVKALSDIGPMEELFWAYGEDKDWGWRALMMGWTSVYVPTAKVLHKWSPTVGESPRKFYLLEFERLLSIWKNYSTRTIILLAPVLLVVEAGVLLHAVLRGWLRAKLQSYGDLLRLRRAVGERRKMVQARRTVPDSVLVKQFVTEIAHPYIIRPNALVLNRLVSILFSWVRNSI